MKEILLIRHTKVAVEAGLCYGQLEVELDEERFPVEAEEVRQQLCPYLGGGERLLVYASPSLRARRLAAACGYTSPQLEARLMELNFGAWEGQRYEDICDPRLQLWYEDYLYTAPTGGESFAEQCTRVASFLSELSEREEKTALLFTHGGVQLASGVWAGRWSLAEAFEHRMPYASILRLEL